VTHLLIYSSPVDHHDPAQWYRYRERIRDALTGAGAGREVSLDDDPLFTYGVDLESVIARVNAVQPGRGEIVLAQWSTIVFYSAAVLFLGEGVDTQVVRSALRSEPFLKEHVGEYTPRSASCHAHQLYPAVDEDVTATRRIVGCVHDRVYVGARWMVNDEEGRVDDGRFEVLRGADGSGEGPLRSLAFRPRVPEIEEEIWKMGAQGSDGVAVLSANDPRLPAILEAADVADELTLFIGDGGGHMPPRVTIGRCHMDDTLVCLYNHPPVTDENLQFLV
jgi:hypothetical protein